mmetsp:Transcript_19545/g.56031  ORF Transcript_19545/g.56031 Transcript_19545/m.56031 type:complete len:537 (-) Transcript_19545:134-1744(-)
MGCSKSKVVQPSVPAAQPPQPGAGASEDKAAPSPQQQQHEQQFKQPQSLPQSLTPQPPQQLQQQQQQREREQDPEQQQGPRQRQQPDQRPERGSPQQSPHPSQQQRRQPQSPQQHPSRCRQQQAEMQRPMKETRQPEPLKAPHTPSQAQSNREPHEHQQSQLQPQSQRQPQPQPQQQPLQNRQRQQHLQPQLQQKPQMLQPHSQQPRPQPQEQQQQQTQPQPQSQRQQGECKPEQRWPGPSQKQQPAQTSQPSAKEPRQQSLQPRQQSRDKLTAAANGAAPARGEAPLTHGAPPSGAREPRPSSRWTSCSSGQPSLLLHSFVSPRRRWADLIDTSSDEELDALDGKVGISNALGAEYARPAAPRETMNSMRAREQNDEAELEWAKTAMPETKAEVSTFEVNPLRTSAPPGDDATPAVDLGVVSEKDALEAAPEMGIGGGVRRPPEDTPEPAPEPAALKEAEDGLCACGNLSNGARTGSDEEDEEEEGEGDREILRRHVHTKGRLSTNSSLEGSWVVVATRGNMKKRQQVPKASTVY